MIDLSWLRLSNAVAQWGRWTDSFRAAGLTSC